MKYKTLRLVSVAACVLPLAAMQARAETVTTKTVTEQTAPAVGKTVDLSNFDLNKDGILSTFEVGEMLFKLFDTDTSGAVDSTEYEFKSVITVVPMTKTTTLSYDYNNDGVPDKTQYTVETFLQNTQLARFDKNKDGLSAHDFLDKTFSAVDTDGNSRIDLVEWRNAYMTIIVPMTP